MPSLVGHRERQSRRRRCGSRRYTSRYLRPGRARRRHGGLRVPEYLLGRRGRVRCYPARAFGVAQWHSQHTLPMCLGGTTQRSLRGTAVADPASTLWCDLPK